MSNTPFDFRPSGSIAFEQLEPEAVAQQVKASADDGMDADPLSIDFGRSENCKPTSAERRHARTTIDRLVAFPLESRPKALCERSPCVANGLAKDWSGKTTSV